MSDSEPPKQTNAPRGVRRIPKNSFLYDRLIPFALIAMAVLMVLIVVAALMILLGGVQF